MRTLGAVLCGGRSSRFGSDKALAPYGDTTMIGDVMAALTAQCAAVVLCGRSYLGHAALPDWPAPDLGPLGGLAAALRHARAANFDAVLTAGCDTPGLPLDLVATLAPAPAVAAGQPVIGLWPAALAPTVEAFQQTDPRRSLLGFADAAGARRVAIAGLRNINSPTDL